ncbi:uncharacterized protein LOC125048010 [Penaeus chinensis]|uniref:uncharacterized protein LOC125048010 n=1 Tax=Penaeus chinensis TaxID=139456 RepID=UPI001FB858F3|nr:uncharacterized protein LOC125048010 [Penaeus chinensis]
MRELNLIDRCVLVVIMLVSTITMTAGGLLILTDGYTEKALVFLVCGGTTSIFTCAGIMVSVVFSRASPSSNDAEAPPPLPYSDPPPEYRFTWREEYLKKSPESLRTELEEGAPERQATEEERKMGAAAKNKNKKKDIRKFVWAHGGEVSAVHSGRRNSVGEQAGARAGDRPRTGRANTVATAGSYGAARPEGRAAPSRASISVVSLAGEVNEGLVMDDEGLPTYEEVQKW